MSSTAPKPLVSIIMGSKSDWETMQHAETVLKQFEIPHECEIVSAHRTPVWLAEFPQEAGATNAGLLAIAILANSRPPLREKLRHYRMEQTTKVLDESLPGSSS